MYLLEGASGPLGPLLPEHISELVVGIVLFFVIFVAIRKVVVPRFEQMYGERADAIRGEMDRADQANTEAKAALAAYKKLLAQAEDEAAQIREAAKQTGAQIEADSRVKADQEAARIVAGARAQVEAETAAAIASLRRDIGTMAVILAGRILGETLEDDTRVNQSVDAFIESLDQDQVRQ